MPKSQEIWFEITNTGQSNFDKQFSGANFVPFLFYYYWCSKIQSWPQLDLLLVCT